MQAIAEQIVHWESTMTSWVMFFVLFHGKVEAFATIVTGAETRAACYAGAQRTARVMAHQLGDGRTVVPICLPGGEENADAVVTLEGALATRYDCIRADDDTHVCSATKEFSGTR